MARTRSIEMWQVDAFASGPFTGNPAAVLVLDEAASEDWMQAVAAENNLSETAFCVPSQPDDSGPVWGLRWFTPAAEVDLCGHATLATAHVLFELGSVGPDRAASFDTRSGRLAARRSGSTIWLDFPATPAVPTPPPDDLVPALGIDPARVEFTGTSRFDTLVAVDDESIVRRLAPDTAAIGRIPTRCVIVTASGFDYDMVSRVFAPAVGIAEDPVTGSAHCALGPYWADHLGRNELAAYQASARGGELSLEVDGDRVRLGGSATTVLRADLYV